MMCATHDRTSDAETSRRTRVDSDWKAAMGIDDWFEGIGATTFSLMRARMVAHDADGALFEKTLEPAVKKGIFKEPLTAIIDSSPVHGAGAVADTYELVCKMMGRLARALGATSTPACEQRHSNWRRPSPTSTGRTPPSARRTSRSWLSWPLPCWAPPRPTGAGGRRRSGRGGCAFVPGGPPRRGRHYRRPRDPSGGGRRPGGVAF